MRHLIVILLAAATSLTAGCVTNCTTIAVGSVNVTVTEPGGTSIPEAELTYLALDLDDAEVTDCEAMPDADTWVCGWEVPGEIEIEISADGYETQVETVQVDEDECHVIGENLDVVLQPVTT